MDGADLGIPFDMDFLAVSNDFYKRSAGTVERIVGGYVEGIAALRADKPKALEVLGKYMRERGGSVEEHYPYEQIRILSYPGACGSSSAEPSNTGCTGSEESMIGAGSP